MTTLTLVETGWGEGLLPVINISPGISPNMVVIGGNLAI